MRKANFIRLNVIFIVILIIITNCYRSFTSAYGPGGGYSNAPGESNCTSCHSGSSINTSSSLITLTTNGSSMLKYKTDSTYTIKVTATRSGTVKWGFEACPLKDSTNTTIGTLGLISSASDVQLTSTSIGGKTRYYSEHTSTGTAGSGTRSWSFTWKAPHTNVGTITFYVAVNATNNDGTDGGDVIYANTFTFSYLPLNVPTAGFTYAPINPCEGDTVTFKDTSTLNPTSWNWTFSGGTPSSSTLQNPKVVFTWGGKKVSLVATNKFGSSSTYSKAVTVTQRPTDTIYRSGPTTFCEGDSLLLTADFVGTVFNWSTGETNQAIHVYKSGSYYCTVSNGNCTTISQVVKVKVIPKPSISVTRGMTSDTICSGDSVVFSITTDGKTHNFYNSGKLIPKTTGNTVKIGGLTGKTNKIYAIAFDSLGCASDTSSIFREVVRTRLAAPLVSAGSSTTQSVTINWTTVTGAKNYEVSADSGKSWKSPSGNLTHTQSGLASNTYIELWVRATDAAPCNTGNIAKKVVSSLPCSQTTYTFRVDSLICPGSKSKVVFSNISAVHYSIIVNGVASKDTVYSFSPQKDTILKIAMYDSLKSACGSFNIDIPVNIVSIPVSSIVADKPFYCGNNDGAVIKAISRFDEYDYYVNGNNIQHDTSSRYVSNFFSDGDKVLMIGKINGCNSAPSNTITLHKYMAPIAMFTYSTGLNREVTFTNKTLTADTRIWYFGDGSTDTSFSPVHTYASNKTYTVSLVSTGAGGCKDSVTQTLSVSGIDFAVDNHSFSIRPNPVDNLMITSFYGNNFGYLHITFIDLQGRIVKELKDVKVSKGTNEIYTPVDELKPGLYIIKINDGLQVISRKIIKN
jgi:PKD repeat protein